MQQDKDKDKYVRRDGKRNPGMYDTTKISISCTPTHMYNNRLQLG